MANKLWKVADAVLLAAFVFSVAVQLNDPDPIPWVLIYALAAAGCVLGLLGRGHWGFGATVCLIAAGWAATIAPHVLGAVPFGDMFQAFEMKDLGVEQSREMYGLLIVAAWMGGLALRTARAARSREEGPGA